MRSDVTLSDSTGSFKYRAAGVIRVGDRRLVCAVEHIDGWFLPGGKVQFGESSAVALARELREELELEVRVTGAPLVVTESIREDDGLLHQEVCFYYAVGWPDGVPTESVDDLTDHRFRRIRLADLSTVRFLPPEIAHLLADGRTGLRHVAFDRRGAG
jgi:8-oxo-dGTP pyrophosphatase MutT (NUDIX family)